MTNRIPNLVIVGDDGGDGGRLATDWARALATVTGAELVIVGVEPSDDPDAAQERCNDLERRVGEPARTAGLSCSCRGLNGDAREVLPAQAEELDAALLIVGDTGHWGIVRPPLGSVANHLAHHSPRPVVVVPAAGGPIDGGTVLAGVDGSPDSAYAVEWAASFAKHTHGSVVALFAQPALADTFATAAAESTWRGPHEQEVTRIVDEARRPDVHVDLRTMYANRIEAILEAADDVDASVVAVGARGRGGFHRLLLGGTATQLLHHSNRPVAIIPGDRTNG